MVERVSALAGHTAPMHFGLIGPEGPGVRLSERRLGSIWLIAGWPDRLPQAGAAAARAAGVAAAPGPGASASGAGGTLMRVEPLKWLLIGEHEIPRPALEPADGTLLELSHARTVIHVSGPRAAELMARMVPLDLRPAKFPEGSVAASVLHHVGVTVLARGGGFDLLVPRSFGLAVWEMLVESAAQFGAEIA
jgi:sarcosine oxidase subunit gamma